MGFFNAGGLSAVCAVVCVGVLVGAMLPSVNWAHASSNNITHTVNPWRNCTSITSSLGDVSVCHNLGKPQLSDYKSERSAERDATIAGCVLGGLVSLLSVLPLICRSKCGALTLQIIAVIFCSAGVACWVRFQTHTLNNSLFVGHYTFGLGFYLAAISIVASIGGMIGACFISRQDRQGYGYLA